MHLEDTGITHVAKLSESGRRITPKIHTSLCYAPIKQHKMEKRGGVQGAKPLARGAGVTPESPSLLCSPPKEASYEWVSGKKGNIKCRVKKP